MIRLTQLADDGTELAAVEVDDFTIEVLYAGLADMLREAAAPRPSATGAFLRPAALRRASAASGSSAASAADPAPRGQGPKGRAATLKRHAHLPGGHSRCSSGTRRG